LERRATVGPPFFAIGPWIVNRAVIEVLAKRRAGELLKAMAKGGQLLAGVRGSKLLPKERGVSRDTPFESPRTLQEILGTQSGVSARRQTAGVRLVLSIGRRPGILNVQNVQFP
jgi:hypothetical protein